jgi:hypothetical protein
LQRRDELLRSGKRAQHVQAHSRRMRVRRHARLRLFARPHPEPLRRRNRDVHGVRRRRPALDIRKQLPLICSTTLVWVPSAEQMNPYERESRVRGALQRQSHVRRTLGATLAVALCACGSDSGSGGQNDASGVNSGNSDANGADATGGSDGNQGGPSPDGGGNDVPAGDALPGVAIDATSDGSGSTTDAGAGDGACAPPSSAPAISCGGANNCNAATNYCLAGSLPNTCKPIPSQCACSDTHDCSCLLAHIPSPCDGGIFTCTPYVDGGQLWIFASNCH